MPTAKALSYDHDVYQTPIITNGLTVAGANGVSAKFAAFTAMQLRRVVTVATVAGTSATTPLLFVKSGTATATTTLTAISSAATTPVENVLSTAVSLVQGDTFWVTHGTDATVVAAAAIECYPTPGATVACP